MVFYRKDRKQKVQKMDSRCLWQPGGYWLLLIALLFSTGFPLSVRTVSAAVFQTQPVTSEFSQVQAQSRLVEQGFSSAFATPTDTEPAPSKNPKPTPEPGQPTEIVKPAAAFQQPYTGPGSPITFTSAGGLIIPDSGSATPYPLTIPVSGVSGNVLAATVRLTNLSHTFSSDVDVLLVGPTGQKTILMSDVGSNSTPSNVNLVFDDTATNSLSSQAIASGSYKPSDLTPDNSCGNDNFAIPAPSSPYSVTLSGFSGLNPNGDWKLYIRDDCSGDSGSLGSWSLILYVLDQPAILTYSGSGQSAIIATSFATPLQAQVKDGSANPLAGATVTFTVPASGASGTFAGGNSVFTGITDASGVVTASTLTANTLIGSYMVTATTSVSSMVATFNLTNTAGSPTSLSPTSGSNQNALINSAFAQPLVATAYDVANNPVISQIVTFTAPASGASGLFANNSTAYSGTTDASGRITTTLFTANSITGTYAVMATVAGVATPASFTLTNTPGSVVQFQSSSYSVNEGAGTAVLTLTRAVTSTEPTTATVVLSDKTTSLADYTLTNFTSGGLDASFNTTGGADAEITHIVIQPDGKILISGFFTTYNGVARKYIARLNSDGTLDTTFDPGSGANNGIGRMALQPDGKILIAGGFTTYNGVARKYVARLNSDGTLDTSFDSSTGANGAVSVVAVQGDGKIVIGGEFTTYNGVARKYVARLNSDGSLDTTFDTSIGVNNIVWDLVVQPADSKVIIVGRFITYNSTSRNKVARLNSDGSLDTTFDPGTGVSFDLDIWRVTLQSDGKVLIGGDFLSFNNTSRIRIARLNSDGSLDGSFDPGSSANNGVRPMVVQPDGKILISGDFTSFGGVSRNHFTRLNSDGSLDASFTVGSAANDFVGAIALQSNGQIFIGGRFTSYNAASANRLARLGPTTQVSWGDGDTAPKTITMTIVDDTILEGPEQLTLTLVSTSSGLALGSPASTPLTIVDNDFPGGVFQFGSATYSVTESVGTAVVTATRTGNSSGALKLPLVITAGTATAADYSWPTVGLPASSFLTNSVGADAFIQSMARQPDGKILIGGYFTTYNGVARGRVARLNSDGSLDTSFLATGVGADSAVTKVVVQPDGKILIGGYFTTYNGASVGRIARLNSDGSLDTSFLSTGAGASERVFAITLQPDGKILIGGEFIVYNGSFRERIARLNSDGSLDTSFLSNGIGFNNYVNTLVVQPDGKILVGGQFTAYNVTTQGLARLNSDGSVDTTFVATGSATNGVVTSMALQPDGKIIIGGAFTTYNGVGRNNLARVLTDGSLDTSFLATDSGASNTIWSLALQVDGSILVGGSFTSFNGVGRSYLARVLSDGSLDTNFLSDGAGSDNAIYSLLIQPDNNILLAGDFTSYNGSPYSRVLRVYNDPAFMWADGETGAKTFSFAITDDFAAEPDETFMLGLVGSGGLTIGNPATTTVTILENDGCHTLQVTSTADDGSCGTLRGALNVASSGATRQVTITLGAGSVITLSSGLTLTNGVSITTTAGCTSGPAIILQGSGNSSGNGLTLAGSNSLYGLWVRGFSGNQIVAGKGNILRCMRASKT